MVYGGSDEKVEQWQWVHSIVASIVFVDKMETRVLFEARKEKMGTNVQNNSELEGREEEVLHNKPESPLLFTPWGGVLGI